MTRISLCNDPAVRLCSVVSHDWEGGSRQIVIGRKEVVVRRASA